MVSRTLIFCNGPAWVDKLMALRDAVVGCFGLKTASKEGEQVSDFPWNGHHCRISFLQF